MFPRAAIGASKCKKFSCVSLSKRLCFLSKLKSFCDKFNFGVLPRKQFILNFFYRVHEGVRLNLRKHNVVIMFCVTFVHFNVSNNFWGGLVIT